MGLLTSSVRGVVPSSAYIVPSGTYVDQFAMTGASLPVSSVTTPDVLYGTALFVTPQIAAIDRIGINLAARTAITLARLGIYLTGADGKPGSLLFDAGEIDCSATGDKEITIAQSLPVGQWVWLSLVTNGTGSMLGYASPFSTPLGWSGVSNTTKRTSYTRAHTYAALPASFSSTGTVTVGWAIRVRAL